jgi:phosphoribosylamine--glycine ligase
MNVLIIGSGGREHALGWAVKQSGECDKLYFAPGNAGTCALGENVAIPVTDKSALADFAERNVDFTIIGPEAALEAGVSDEFRKRGLRVFGPSKDAARLETSKAYAKSFMKKYGIPTADYAEFNDYKAAVAALDAAKFPCWVKADGIAAGKGAVYCADKAEAEAVINNVMREGAFGSAGDIIVLEEHMEGRELTLLCLTDGETILPMESARDHKRALDGDKGLNTGGMGCVSPVPGYTNGSADFIADKVLKGIKAEGLDYRGVIYIELMLTHDGPKVIEFNVRFGDPEAQVLLPRLETDFLETALAAEARRLSGVKLKWKPGAAVCVVAASGGYPEKYKTGLPMQIPPDGGGPFIVHAGTKLINGTPCTDGGRVLAVTGCADNAEEARRKAYALIERVSFEGMHYRKDIGI